MRNEILRDLLFGCAGVFMVIAVIGLPRPAQVAHQQWQVQFQDPHLLPYYSSLPPRSLLGPGTGGPAGQTP